ncbi:MAG: hypothetical protein IPP83_01480 [Flavobacteriales bacterium]|nr:hypothetical protein [Flavobacteriales bacterium]
MHRLIAILLLVLLCSASRAQEPETFEAFMKALHALPRGSAIVLDPAEYVMVWQEKAAGGALMHFPGSGITLEKFQLDRMRSSPWSPLIQMHEAVYFGDRYAMVMQDEPTSLPRFTRWYFERKAP